MPLKAESYVDEYQPATFENISNLLWKFGVHEQNNQDVYTSYFQLTNCPLFQKYYKDDFVWQKIIESFRRDIKYFAKDIPNKFYITAAIPIERYDFQKSAFIVDEEFALDNAGSIQIPFYESTLAVCVDQINKTYFPEKVKFIADQKFALEEIPMNIDQANLMLERIKKYRYENIQSNRVVAIRFLVTITAVENYSAIKNISEVVYKGTLDEIAFFEDPQMTKLIWKKQFKVFED